jgi:hypothetical protein
MSSPRRRGSGDLATREATTLGPRLRGDDDNPGYRFRGSDNSEGPRLRGDDDNPRFRSGGSHGPER